MKKALTLTTLLTFPMVAFAQAPTNLLGLIAFVGDVFNRIIPVLIAAALVVFFWGLVRYILKPKTGAKQIMTAGLVSLFVMVSVWGLIRIAQNTLGITNAPPVGIPQVPQAR